MYDSPTTRFDDLYQDLNGGSQSPSLTFMSPRMERSIAQLSGTPQRTQRVRRRASPLKPANLNYGSSLTAPPIMHRLAGRASDASSSYAELGANTNSSDFDWQTVGTSTFLQSSLNGVNILLGVGVLSLPYSMSVSGWWVGMGLLIALSLITNYTGKIIGRLMSLSDQIAPSQTLVGLRLVVLAKALLQWSFSLNCFRRVGCT